MDFGVARSESTRGPFTFPCQRTTACSIIRGTAHVSFGESHQTAHFGTRGKARRRCPHVAPSVGESKIPSSRSRVRLLVVYTRYPVFYRISTICRMRIYIFSSFKQTSTLTSVQRTVLPRKENKGQLVESHRKTSRRRVSRERNVHWRALTNVLAQRRTVTLHYLVVIAVVYCERASGMLRVVYSRKARSRRARPHSYRRTFRRMCNAFGAVYRRSAMRIMEVTEVRLSDVFFSNLFLIT